MSVLLHWLGLDNASGRVYLFWSGFFGDISILVAFVLFLHHLNCGNKGCWHMARHTTANGHKLCKTCIRKPNEELRLHDIHPDHKGTS
jgi:hypothetical protein